MKPGTMQAFAALAGPPEAPGLTALAPLAAGRDPSASTAATIAPIRMPPLNTTTFFLMLRSRGVCPTASASIEAPVAQPDRATAF